MLIAFRAGRASYFERPFLRFTTEGKEREIFPFPFTNTPSFRAKRGTLYSLRSLRLCGFLSPAAGLLRKFFNTPAYRQAGRNIGT